MECRLSRKEGALVIQSIRYGSCYWPPILRHTQPLASDLEFRLIQEVFDQTSTSRHIECQIRPAARPADLLGAIREFKPHAIHMSLHGDRSARLVMEDEHGNPKHVSYRALTHVFRTMGTGIRVVICNACFSAEFARSIAAYVDIAIGIRENIEDPVAMVFSRSFYRVLSRGGTIGEAFDIAILELEMENIPPNQHPQLYPRPGVEPHGLKLETSIVRSGATRARLATMLSIVLVLSIVSLGTLWQRYQDELRQARNLGVFHLSAQLVDWDPYTGRAEPVSPADFGDLRFTLYTPDHRKSGHPSPSDDRNQSEMAPLVRWEQLHLPSRSSSRHPVDRRSCGSTDAGGMGVSAHHRGYTFAGCRDMSREAMNRFTKLKSWFRTCEMTESGMIEIPEGEYYWAGMGEPPLSNSKNGNTEMRDWLADFSIDRNEVTNAQYAVYAHMATVTGVMRCRSIRGGTQQQRSGAPRCNYYLARSSRLLPL